MPDDTITVEIRLLRLERATAGALALASLEIDIGGVVLVINGIRVVKTGPRRRGIAAPSYRMATGRLAEAVILPGELLVGVARVVLDAYDDAAAQPPVWPLARSL